MQIASLAVACTLVAAHAHAQGTPVLVTQVLQPAPAGAAPASASLSPARRAVDIRSKLSSVQSQIAASGIAYICDVTIANNAGTGTCNTLNTVIASLYASAFTNAGARIYITLGNTGLGENVHLQYSLTYQNFRAALQSSQSDGDDITALADSVPATDPIPGNSQVLLPAANYRALGFATAQGIEADGHTQCSLTGNACYDGVITISNAASVAGQLYYRNGTTIGPNQYDFFTVVEHETDEVLGTGSCVLGCSTNSIAPPDLFRYQSNGARSSLAAGNNTSCSVSTSGNACFSLDGVQMLEQYNNLSNGEDTGDWLTNCLHPLVQDAVGCLGVAGVDISPAAEIRVLDVVGFTLATPVTVQVVTKLTSSNSGIVNGVCSTPASVSNFTITSPQVWMYFSVTGANVGDTAQTTYIRPDGVVYATLNSAAVTSAGSQCFSNFINVNGQSAASYPGTWTIQVAWDQSSTPLFTLNFNVFSSTCPYTLDSSGQAFPAAGGVASISVSVPAGCSPWTVSGAPAWVTPVGFGGSGNGTLSYQVSPNSGPDRLGTMTVAGVPYTIEQEATVSPGPFFGSMPHIAAEENWTTAFTLVNKGAISAQARLSLFGDPSDPSGNGPLTLPLTFPQQQAASVPMMAASIDQTLAANASVIIDTAGAQNPPVLVGSAQVAASNNVDGFAIFHLIPGAQEAIVPLESRNAPSYVLAYDNTGSVVLGVAVANVSAQSATIGIVLRNNNGAQINAASDNIVVPANGHMSFDLSSKYPVTETTFQTGTIEFDTPAGGQISVLGIRTTPLETTTTLTTVPALANVGTNGGSIAHLATGNGWQTTFVLVNTGSVAANPTLRFFDNNGVALPLPISYPPAPATTVVSSLTQILAAGGMLMVQSVKPASDPAPTVGSAQLTAGGNVSGFVIFRYNPNGQEAVVPLDSSTTANGRIIAFDNTNGTATGLAVNSVASASVNIPVVLRDDSGNLITTDTITLSANGHYSFTLGVDRYQQYPQAVSGRGTIEFDTPANGQIGALGIRIPAGHTFTTLPALIR